MTNIVYQAYGKKEILYQTIYSTLSLLAQTQNKDFRVVIYTDQIDFLKKFFNTKDPIHYEFLSPEQMAKWKGEINFNHRMKIEILNDCSKKYDGNILYLDGDTYFVKDITETLKKITESQSIMHIAEHQLSKTKDILAKKLNKFLKKNEIHVRGKNIPYIKDFMMWNAGAIGLHRKHHGIFQDIIDYTDELFKKYPKHVMEQYAVSYCLQKNTTLTACDDAIEHYWNQKDSFESILVKFFDKYQCFQTYSANKNKLQFPKRHYGKPKYTFKQKMKHKFNRLKYYLGMQN